MAVFFIGIVGQITVLMGALFYIVAEILALPDKIAEKLEKSKEAGSGA